MSSYDSADKGKYFCDDGTGGGTANDGVKHADESMMNPWGTKNVPGWPKPMCTSSQVVPVTQAPVDFAAGLNDYGSETALLQQVDATLAGVMRDCAECHIGGSAMEYIPVAPGDNLAESVRGADDGPRLNLRPGSPNAYSNPTAEYNAYTYFIDQYDEDGDGFRDEVLRADYANSGVLEMDCLMCHMEGYSWTDRTHVFREGKLDTSRVVGAGLGTDDYTGAAMGANYGKTVAYDGSMVEDDGLGNATLSALAMTNIEGTPPDANCSSCHFDMHQVDWKKRGTSWAGDYMNEVHSSLGCMGCHASPTAQASGATSTDNSALTGAANAVFGHDPGKSAAPFSSVWNKTDSGNIKTCANCHIDQIDGDYGGTCVDPTAKHASLGLTALIMQDGRDGDADSSHLDVISCEACHTRKLGHGPTEGEGGHTHGSLYEWGTGAAMVDSTAPDAEGRLTDHENLYIERTMENNMVRSWQGGKLRNKHSLITMFWRDKDDNTWEPTESSANYFDVNADLQTGGMDAVNPFHVRNAMEEEGLGPLTHGLTTEGDITPADVAVQRAALFSYLTKDDGSVPGTTGDDGISDTNGQDWTDMNGSGRNWSAGKLKLSFMGVAFLANHNTSPKENAWGSGGCTDCHGADKGFYNGNYELKGRDLDISFASTDVAPFTKVNKADYDGDAPGVPLGSEKADWQFTDFHPTLFAKGLRERTIAVNVRTGNTLRDIDKSELMYENDSTVVGGPGARTMVDGTVAGTRTEIVDSLNTAPALFDGMHKTHYWVEIGHDDETGALTTCTDCHVGVDDFSVESDDDWTITGCADYLTTCDESDDVDAGTVDGTFNGVEFDADPIMGQEGCNEWGIVGDEVVCIDIIPAQSTGHYTCTTTCHNQHADPDRFVVEADFSYQHSLDSDRTIAFSAQYASCYILDDENLQVEVDCTYEWGFGAGGDGTCIDTDPPTNAGGTCGVSGGNGTDIRVIEYDSEGDYDVTLTMTMVDDPTTLGYDESENTSTITVTGITAENVVPVAPAIDFTTAVAGNTVTLGTAAAFPADVARVYVYWGDRKRTLYKNPGEVMEHTYVYDNTYNIRVYVLTDTWERFNYTFAEDLDLTVTIP